MPNTRVRYPFIGPLGRNVNHDPRSRRFPVRAAAQITSVMHDRRIPVLDQGDLGSCTGNAGIGCMGTGLFYQALGGMLSQLPLAFTFDEPGAVKLYSAATALDDFYGTYPPDDTGSDGLSIAKALHAAGWISGYEHAFGMDAFLAGLMTRPCIVGTEWYSGMGSPDARGVVRVRGSLQGGHEYQAIGYDATARLVWFVNSWGAGWGKGGFFAIDRDEFARLLGRQGDATFFTPLSTQAPRPEPVDADPDVVLADALRGWAASDAIAFRAQRVAFRAWLSAKGL
jgi:hypothetical protein